MDVCSWLFASIFWINLPGCRSTARAAKTVALSPWMTTEPSPARSATRGCADVCPIIRPYCGGLIAGIRPTTDGETLFEGYACDYHKATLRSYSYIAPPMVGRYRVGQPYVAAQGRVFVVRYGHGQAGNWQELEDAAQKVVASYRYAPYGLELYPCPAALAAQVVR
jgi:hypothetical protein